MNGDIMTFRKNALLADICKEWDIKWMSCMNDKEKLVRLALMQQSIPYVMTFCYNGKGVSREYALNEFRDEINSKQHIDCDETGRDYLYSLHITNNNVELTSDVAAFMWCDDIHVNVRRTKCPIIYIGCNSNIHLSCEGYNSCIVYMFDTSTLNVELLDTESELLIYKYSQNCKVIKDNFCFGKMTEHIKTLRL